MRDIDILFVREASRPKPRGSSEGPPAPQPRCRRHGTATANVDVAVVGIAAEAVTPAFQFLVEIIEHEVAQKGRKRATLRCPFIHRTDQTVLHYPSVEKRPDELEYALVGNPFRDVAIRMS
jgi:hypothetical protein